MAKRRLKPNFTEEDLGANAFISKDRFVIKVSPGLQSVTDKNGNTHYQEKNFEKDKYCRLYNSPESRMLVSKLKPYAKELLIWLIYELDAGKDYVWLNRERYMEEAGVKSPTTVSLAVKELRFGEFIMPSNVREIYYINPKHFFFGSRINAFKENVLVVK